MRAEETAVAEDATSDAETAIEAEDEGAPAAGAATAAPAAGQGGDALLNMFQTTQIEEVDRGAVLELAGDVELADLLDDLQTVATALGLRR